MNDHNLDDLIIDNLEPKNSKTKSFLTIIALLIVVLITAIILTKIILKDPNTDKLTFEENNTEMISPELTLQSAAEPKPKKEESELSNIIENKLKAPAPVEEVAKETIEITKEVIKVPEQPKAKTEVEKSTKEEERLQKEKEYSEARKARLEQERLEKAKAAEKAKTAEKVKAAQEKIIIKKVVPQVVKSVPTPTVEKAKKRPVNVPEKSNATASQTYYIQVGSFTKTPSKQFLGIIKKSGFNYKITPKAANGTKKLLIGPYKNRASANTALARVKDRINKNAFVVKK